MSDVYINTKFDIIFYFPFRHPSGVSNLFVRMAQWLAGPGNLHVAVIDYRDGHMAINLVQGGDVALIDFEDSEKLFVPSDAILVMQSLLPYTLPENFIIHPETRIVMWDFLYYSLVNTLIPIRPIRLFQYRYPWFYHIWMRNFQPKMRAAIASFIGGMIEKESLLFHDRQIVQQTTDYLAIPIENPLCLPVPVKIVTLSQRLKNSDSILHCGWVGRLYDFKIHMLVHVVERMSEWSRQAARKTVFHIVGDGDEGWRLDELKIENKFFTMKREGSIPSAQLESFMEENFDITFSMGTSALESAALGIPSVLLDYSFVPIQGKYHFKWLFDSIPGDIGHKIGRDDLESGTDSLEKLLEEYFHSKSDISKKVYAFCKENHSMDAIGSRFLEIVMNAKYRWGDIPLCLRKVSLARRLRNHIRQLKGYLRKIH